VSDTTSHANRQGDMRWVTSTGVSLRLVEEPKTKPITLDDLLDQIRADASKALLEQRFIDYIGGW